MIFPWIQGISHFIKAPLTWILLLINVFWFLVTHQASPTLPTFEDRDSSWIEMAKQELLERGGLTWLEESSQIHPEVYNYKMVLDPRFAAELTAMATFGDPIEFKYRQNKMLSLYRSLQLRHVEQFGFKGDQWTKWPTWFTYQFMHGGYLHLLSNMIMLLLFGAAVERAKGSGFLLGTYLLSGIAGAMTFALVGGSGAVPLVGASAAVSGIIAAYLIVERKKAVKFFYFMGFQNMGVIYLPTFIIVFYFLVDDLAKWLGQNPNLGSAVAHTAHIGGFIFGAILAKAWQWTGGSLNYSSVQNKN